MTDASVGPLSPEEAAFATEPMKPTESGATWSNRLTVASSIFWTQPAEVPAKRSLEALAIAFLSA